MIARFLILRSALFLGALFLIVLPVSSQYNVLELLPGSDELRYDSKTGLHTLVGNVSFKYQGNLMYCDSAIYSKSRKMVWAYGNVHINKRDTLNLFCDSLRYNGGTKKAKLKGNVRVRDQEYKLTTNELDYDADLGQASYYSGGRVESSKTREILTSKVGYFYPESKNFSFSSNVVYEGPEMRMTTDTLQYRYGPKKAFFYGPTHIFADKATMYCESGWYQTTTEEGQLSGNAWIHRDSSIIKGDTLLYLPKSGTYEGIGNVFYMDSTDNLSFTGDYAFSSDSMFYTLITGDAIATKMMENDTLHIHADTLYNFKKDSIDILKAFHGARSYSNKFQSSADSLVYDKGRQIVELYRNPIVWAKDSELKGRFMEMCVNDSVIEAVNIYDKGTILMEVQPKTYYNQIHGNDIKALFQDNQLYKAYVYGNAMTISYPEEKEESDTAVVLKRKGMNRLYSSDIRVDLDSSEIVGITYLTQPDGAFHPLNRIPKDEQFVPGFVWKGYLRPTSAADLIHDPALPSSEDIDPSLSEGREENTTE